MKKWKDFFSTHQKTLEHNYPGLNEFRFLREMDELKDLPEIEEKVLRGVPFSYLLGYTEFFHAKFKVTPDVLIPRPETEYLIELVLNQLAKDAKTLVDVGCGSGCIGLSILKARPDMKGVLIDVSQAALDIASINAKNLGLMDRVEFIRTDRLQGIDQKFDLIVSNPPYIKRKTHQHLVHEKVKEFEPDLALFLDDEVYHQWFSEFFKQVQKCLKPAGLFAMEGHEDTLKDLSPILPGSLIHKDLGGCERFLFYQVN